MGDPQSRLFSSYPPTSFVVKSLILQFCGAFGVVGAFVTLHTAPQNHYFAGAFPTRELPFAFITVAPSSSSISRVGVMYNIMNEHILSANNEGDDASEDNSPRRGRPGIVVFSGGTAFNAASAEMASRSVMDHLRSVGGRGGDDDYDDVEGVSRSNSLSSLVDMMEMGTMETMTSTRSDVHPSNNIASGGGGLKVWHVLPVTDDGGSTAEIVRVLGGPAVGDIRSRLLRLAPGTTREARAVRRLLGHRLVSMQSLDERHLNGSELSNESVSRMAREEWLDILEGGQYQINSGRMERGNEDDRQSYEHPLWKDVSAPYRSVSIHICNSTLVSILAGFSQTSLVQIIRAFLVHFHNQVLQTHNGVRQSQSNLPFDFTGGSVGNFFFAGARTFFGSLPAAIFLFSKVAGIPSGSRVLPAVISEERLELGAQLKDGTRIRGQYNISHPHSKNKPQHQSKPQSETPRNSNKTSRHRQVVKSSLDSEEAISSLHSSPITKIAYLLHDPTWRRLNEDNRMYKQLVQGHSTNIPLQQWSDRHEIALEPNPLVLDAISNANIIVYGCGSLFTSLLPSLVLDGVGPAISSRKKIKKVLLLNGWHDCETSWTESSSGDDDDKCIVKQMDASSIVKAVVDALDQGSDVGRDGLSVSSATDYITHIFFPIGTEIDIDEKRLATLCDMYMQRNEQSMEERRQDHPLIQVRGIDSITADACSDGIRSGGQTHHRVFDPRALVDALIGLAT